MSQLDEYGEPRVFITQHPPDPRTIDSLRKSRLFIRLGVTHILLSIASFGLGVSLVIYSVVSNGGVSWLDQIGSGVWNACFFFTSGILGIISGKKQSQDLVIAALVMAIFSALAAGILCGFEITAVCILASLNYTSEVEWATFIGLHVSLAFFGLIEFVVSIVHASCCCNCNNCIASVQIDAGTVTYTYDNADAFQQPHVDRPRQNSFFQVGQPRLHSIPEHRNSVFDPSSELSQLQSNYQRSRGLSVSPQKPFSYLDAKMY